MHRMPFSPAVQTTCRYLSQENLGIMCICYGLYVRGGHRILAKLLQQFGSSLVRGELLRIAFQEIGHCNLEKCYRLVNQGVLPDMVRHTAAYRRQALIWDQLSYEARCGVRWIQLAPELSYL
jgi:hypothetical protein